MRKQTKSNRRYIAMSVPGRTEADAASWFVFDRNTYRSVEVPTMNAAVAQARALNEKI